MSTTSRQSGLKSGATRLGLLLAGLLVAPLAWGHGIDVFATVEGDSIHGTLRYADQTPIAGASVVAYGPDGAVIVETHSDAEGRFTLPVTQRCDYRIEGDAGAGHTGTYTVPESELSVETSSNAAAPGESASAPGLEAQIERVVARQLAPLRQQLFEHDRAIRLRDLLGGIGYVFGLAGIVVLLKHRKAPDS